MVLLLVSLLVCANAVELSSIEGDVYEIQQILNDESVILSSLLKKSQDIGREARMISSKCKKIKSTLQKSTDVLIYEVFNTEIQKKADLADNQGKTIKKSLKEGAVTKRIEKVIEYYVKRQQVPDPEMHQHLLQLERKVGDVAHTVKNVYNVDWLYLTLIVLCGGLIQVWRIVKIAEKRHLL